MNAWDDTAFRAAVEKAGKKRLVFGALYTEICLAFPVVDAMRDGYDSMFVVERSAVCRNWRTGPRSNV